MPFVNRFFINTNGAATFTGNTLGLSRSNSVAVPGTVDSIGAFVTTNTGLTFGTYPAGTTGNYALNNSSAVLQLPPGSTVLYAELIWGGTYINNGVNLSAFINDPVGFQTPVGSFSITPASATAMEVVVSNDPGGSPVSAYVRSADVTSLVAGAGAGTYTTSGVVGTIVIPDPTSNHAGWTLAVFYHNASQPLRNLSLRVGATVILATSGPVDTPISGFATPFLGTLNGRALVGAQEGDANKTGDQMLFGPNSGSLMTLSGPNNFVNNFFASQLNKDDGTLDTSGTFGTRNQVNGQPGFNIVGGRQGWDITNVSISPTLSNAQTTAVFRLTTNGDGYLVDSIGIQIDIAQPILEVEKSANRSVTVVGDIVTYTVKIKNTGVVNATAVVFFDGTIDGAAFMPGSVRVNGVQVPGGDPLLGVPIGTIAPNTTVTIMFDEQVVSVPEPPQLVNQAFAAFTFQPTPDSQPISTSVPSNLVKIPILLPLIAVEKSADLMNAIIGDTITYTLSVTNVGNIAITAIITDPLPVGTTFVAGSVFVNGINQPGDNPNVGIDVGVLNLIQTITITYKLLVTAAPPNNLIHNQFKTDFIAQLPDGRNIPGAVISNPVDIPVTSPMLAPIKSADLPSAIVGETITYTVSFTNNNAFPLTQVVVTDNVPAGSSFVPNSVTVGGNPSPAASPLTGIPIGTLAPNASAIVTFQLKVDSLPDPATLTDQATVTFTAGTETFKSMSNPVTIPVITPGVSLIKRAGVATANVGDVVNYSITATNTGSIAYDSAIVFDPLNAFSAFVPGTVMIDGVLAPAASPITGIPVGVIAPGGSVVVSYDVLMTASPPDQFYVNQANETFTYTPPGRPTLPGDGVSNIVIVQNTQFTLSIAKSVSSPTAAVGDVLNYTIQVTNLGAVDSLDTIVTDSSSPGGQFVSGSLKLGGVPITGDLAAGINIGTVPAGGTAVVTFQVAVVAVPLSGVISDVSTTRFTSDGIEQTAVSNPVSVSITQPTLTATKQALQPFVFVGDIINYRSTITNSGSFNSLATWFDILPEGTSFVENSVALNGFPVPGANRFTGTFLGTIEAGITNVITFQLKVEFYPPSGVLVNQGNMLLQFTLPDGRSFNERILTNPVTVVVLAPPSIVKSVSANEVFVGGAVTYTVDISNPGTTPFDRVVLQDIVPNGLSFIDGTLTVGGAVVPGANPARGVSLGSIGPKNNVRVTFAARAVREPENPHTVNTSSITFDYVAPDGRRVPSAAQSNPVTVLILEEEE
ncbi:conserved repeat domain protein [Paenibacillus curdlanolyticus YK9]|uniref:Conserved repeat domain protein n=1 Tax=Paenibacillus curdlanolyticus YK9 TaxID=717606 RepID=E0IAV2_9BACL|nr:DUF11 domain-containing protein [Paenibacillus curdlanolyticus]EFM10506.1 conserved repeat domain protein [Paenibacillus curdlanolyticus YK9]